MGMDVTNVERYHTTSILCARWTIERYASDPSYLVKCVLGQLDFMLSDPVHANVVQIVNCGSKTNDVCNIGSSTLEFVGKVVVPCLILVDLLYHIASSYKGWHLFKDFLLDIQYPNTCRSKHLMRGESHEIAVHLLDIHRHMRN